MQTDLIWLCLSLVIQAGTIWKVCSVVFKCERLSFPLPLDASSRSSWSWLKTDGQMKRVTRGSAELRLEGRRQAGWLGRAPLGQEDWGLSPIRKALSQRSCCRHLFKLLQWVEWGWNLCFKLCLIPKAASKQWHSTTCQSPEFRGSWLHNLVGGRDEGDKQRMGIAVSAEKPPPKESLFSKIQNKGQYFWLFPPDINVAQHSDRRYLPGCHKTCSRCTTSKVHRGSRTSAWTLALRAWQRRKNELVWVRGKGGGSEGKKSA